MSRAPLLRLLEWNEGVLDGSENSNQPNTQNIYIRSYVTCNLSGNIFVLLNQDIVVSAKTAI